MTAPAVPVNSSVCPSTVVLETFTEVTVRSDRSLGANTRTVTSADAVSWPSEPVNRSTYVPRSVIVTVVAGEPGFANVALPGPLTLDQAAVSVPPRGRPSSTTVPFRLAVVCGCTIVCGGPALTTG